MTGSANPQHDLLRIVARDHSQHTPEEIAAAETKLTEALSQERDRIASRVKRNGGIVAAIGLVMGLWPVAIVPIFVSQIVMDPTSRSTLPISGWSFFFLFGAIGIVQAVCGFALFAGGLAFRKYKEWGRRLIVKVLWVGIGYCLAFGIFWEVFVAVQVTSDPAYENLVLLIFGPFIVAFWVFLLWLAKRYFTSAIVVTICEVAHVEADNIARAAGSGVHAGSPST